MNRISKKNRRLLNRKLDGELTDKEELQFLGLMEKEPAAVSYMKELQALESRLESDQAAMKEIDLTREIINKLPMDTYKQPPTREPARLNTGFRTRPAVKYALVFTAGLFIGMLAFSFLLTDQTSLQEESLTGTMAGSRENMKTADVIQYTSEQVTISAQVRYSTRIVEIRLQLSSPGQIRAVMGFNYNDFSVYNIQNISVNDQTSAMSAGNSIQISNTGDNTFMIHLANRNSLPNNIDFRIYQSDSQIYQYTIQVNKE